MLSLLSLSFVASLFLATTSALPAENTHVKSPRALQPTTNLLMNQALNTSSPFSPHTNLTLTSHEPYCFIDAFLPIIDHSDCLYTDYAISSDTRFGPSITEPVTWTRGARWRVRTCAIFLAPNTQRPEDTFSRLEILTQAHRVLDTCVNTPRGFRGGQVPFGNQNFRILMTRPLWNVLSED